jgi:hypothetical protein
VLALSPFLLFLANVRFCPYRDAIFVLDIISSEFIDAIRFHLIRFLHWTVVTFCLGLQELGMSLLLNYSRSFSLASYPRCFGPRIPSSVGTRPHSLIGNALEGIEGKLKTLPNMSTERFQSPFNKTLGEVTILHNDYRKEKGSRFADDPTPAPLLVAIDRTVSHNTIADAEDHVIKWEDVLPGSIVRFKVRRLGIAKLSARWAHTVAKPVKELDGC